MVLKENILDCKEIHKLFKVKYLASYFQVDQEKNNTFIEEKKFKPNCDQRIITAYRQRAFENALNYPFTLSMNSS